MNPLGYCAFTSACKRERDSLRERERERERESFLLNDYVDSEPLRSVSFVALDNVGKNSSCLTVSQGEYSTISYCDPPGKMDQFLWFVRVSV